MTPNSDAGPILAQLEVASADGSEVGSGGRATYQACATEVGSLVSERAQPTLGEQEAEHRARCAAPQLLSRGGKHRQSG
jgi:hypothetical protein